MVQECLRTSGAVGGDEEVGAVAVGVGDLGQGRFQDGDVVVCGVGAGVARPRPTFLSKRPTSLMASRDGRPDASEITISELYRLPLVHVPANVAFHCSIEAHLRAQGAL
ncbi:hypothetical protein [Streptomyces rhizosphaericus]|uniref:Uncharacterized protein n=1 Tax=Streptomyces rhizosphaericus TaxID=114699 RepID=A0A6G4AHG5_9ACTN|nr:hypothetical protein [Streptomyces rhizosphaericus]NEW72678.1 hypothetical protein [Streptomyces rhizosphaericus]